MAASNGAGKRTLSPPSWWPTTVALCVLGGAACGGRSSLEAGLSAGSSGGAGIPSDVGLPPEAGAPLDGCAPPLAVPSGMAWIGHFIVDASGAPSPMPCDWEVFPGFGGKRFSVPRFFLDQDEVTNECYGHCVYAGACEPPIEILEPPVPPSWEHESQRRLAAIVDLERAATFCAWRGGRLASMAELVRASHADAANVCLPSLYEAWIECYFAGFDSSETCLALVRRSLRYYQGDRPFQAVRSDPRDKGPFGHYDLFGSQAEYTRTADAQVEEDVASYCKLADGALAPVTYSDHEAATRLLFTPAQRLYISLPGALTGLGAIGNGLFDSGPDVERWWGGVRCAYDPAPD